MTGVEPVSENSSQSASPSADIFFKFSLNLELSRYLNYIIINTHPAMMTYRTLFPTNLTPYY